MRWRRASAILASAGATVSALATLSCCLPWGIGAALGALGLSVFFVRFQFWFIVLSILLLCFGLFEALRRGRSCRRHAPIEITLLGIAAVVVISVVLFPQWVATLLVGRLP